MKKIIFLLIITLNVQCQNKEIIIPQPPPYRFSNFNDTPAEELAKAVMNQDSVLIKSILVKDKSLINYKDKKYNMNLFALAIVNNKRISFEIFLKNNVNVNEIYGIYDKKTPLLLAIQYLEDCNSFFIERLVVNGSDINQKIKDSDNDKFLREKIALFELTSIRSDSGEACIDVGKFLITKGADLNMCIINTPFTKCFSIIDICLNNNNIDLLIYIFEENLVEIPKEIELESIDGIEKVDIITYLKSEEFDFPFAPDYRIKRDELIKLIQNKRKH
jgi:hypothetical protein